MPNYVELSHTGSIKESEIFGALPPEQEAEEDDDG